MTGPCSGAGVGVPKAGFASTQYIGPAAIGGALAGLSGWQGAAVGATIGFLTYELATFCPSGPPTMPTLSAPDIFNLLIGPSSPLYGPAVTKFGAWLANVFWPLLCDCSSGASVVPAPSAYPAAGPGDNVAILPAPGLCGVQAHDGIPFTMPSSGDSGIIGIAFADYPNLTLIRLHYKANTAGAFSHAPTPVYIIWNGPGISYRQPYGVSVPDSVERTADFTPLPGYTSFNAGLTSAGISADTHEMWAEIFCGAAGAPSPGCCPPDLALQAQIDQILQLVTLIQRQSVPFGYVTGTVHAGLSGAGAISISGLLGVKIAITTLPGYLGSAGTSPPIHFDAGFITFGTADGFPGSHRLERNPQVILPPRCSAYTDLDYDLSPGVIVTITELLREP